MELDPLWSLFTKKAGYVATCNTCHKDYSYRASVSNLRKHWFRKHRKRANGRPSEPSDSDRPNSDNSDVEQEEKVVPTKKSKATWNYFEVVDSDKFEATCKICEKVVSFTSSSDLTQHIQQEHGEEPKDSDEEYVPQFPKPPYKRRHFKSRVWKFFTPTNDTMAVCLLCKNLLTYSTTISNLHRHIKRKHNGAMTPPQEEKKKVYRMADDGTLFEIVSGQEDNNDTNQEDPMATDTVYLNEEELDFDEPEPLTSSPKKRPLPKSNFTSIKKEQVHRSKDTRSEETVLPRKQIPMNAPNTMGSLDYFGQYVVSLLKDLPKPVSDQLQIVIVKQILTSKTALEPDAAAAKYEIKISQNNETVTNIPEPVSFAVVQSNEVFEKLNEITNNVSKIT